MDSCVELCWTSKGKQRPLRGNGSPIDSGSSSSRENWRFLNLQYVFFCLIRMTRQVNIYIYIFFKINIYIYICVKPVVLTKE